MSDVRAAHVAAALTRDWNMIPALADDMAATALAAVDEWGRRPCSDVADMVEPLTRLLDARDRALDRLAAAWDMPDRTVGVMLALRRVDAVVEAHRALVIAQAGDQ